MVYFSKDGATGQCTVVTAASGPRVVRGREVESARYHDAIDGLFAGAA